MASPIHSPRRGADGGGVALRAVAGEFDALEQAGVAVLALGLGHDGGVGERRIGQLGPIGGIGVVVPRKAGVDRLAIRPALARVGIIALAAIGVSGRLAFRIADHVGGVVGDDVHIDLHPARMGGIDEGLEFGIGAEMRINLCEVRHPVAVIA